jgi:hypothetical protein
VYKRQVRRGRVEADGAGPAPSGIAEHFSIGSVAAQHARFYRGVLDART